MLTQAAIIKFKEIYLQEYGMGLSDQNAYEQASRLLNLYRAVYLATKVTKERKVYEAKI